MADDNEIELTEEQALNILEEYFNSESHSESDSELESNTQKPKEKQKEKPKQKPKPKPAEANGAEGESSKQKEKKRKKKKPKDPNAPKKTYTINPRIQFLSEMMRKMKIDNSPIPQRQRMRYIHDIWAEQQKQKDT